MPKSGRRRARALSSGKHPSDDVLLQEAVKLHLVQGLPQAKVADRLRTNQTEISRLIRRAREHDLIKLSVVAPADSDASFLKERFGLRAVVIVASSPRDPSAGLDELGYGGAKYLVEMGVAASKIGISCGSTTRAVARALATRFRAEQLPSACEIFPLNAVHESFREASAGVRGPADTLITSAIHPTTMVGSMLSALPDASGTLFVLTSETASRVQDKLHNLVDLDHYIVGIGSIDFEGRKRSLGVKRKSHEFNALMWAIPGAADALKDAVGECLYQPYTRDGELLFEDRSLHKQLQGLKDIIAYLPVAALKRAARGGANVIAVAGGQRKTRAIHTALTMGLCNVLVTDAATAAAIVDAEKGSPR